MQGKVIPDTSVKLAQFAQSQGANAVAFVPPYFMAIVKKKLYCIFKKF